jgi:excisionase family DNA binding protein
MPFLRPCDQGFSGRMSNVSESSTAYRHQASVTAEPAATAEEATSASEEPMPVERCRLYRVKVVAEALDVSVATIYRAVESGALGAVRLGTGKGAVRIPGDAITAYISACERAAAKTPRSQGEPSEAVTCVICGAELGTSQAGRYIVGTGQDGAHLFACKTHQVQSPTNKIGGAA